MTWLRVDETLADDPAVFRAAAKLGLDDSDLFLGKLVRLSSWVARYALDGDLRSFDAAEIARAAAWPSDPQVFLNALHDSGLISEQDDRLELRDWWEMQGKHREFQKRDAQRKAIKRAAKKKSEGCPGDVQQSSNGRTEDVSANVRTDDSDDTHDTNGPTLPLKMAGDPDFGIFWGTYPKRKSKADARKAWKQTAKSRPPLPFIVAKLEELMRSPEWRKDGGQYIPYPATWLRRGGWDDEVTPPNSNIDTFESRPEPAHPDDIAKYSGSDGSPHHPMWDTYYEVHEDLDGPWEQFDDWLARQDSVPVDAIESDPSTNTGRSLER